MMGLLSSISKAVLTPITAVGNVIGKTLQSTGIVKSFTPQSASTLSQTTFGKVLGTSIAATGAALVSAVAVETGAAAAAAKAAPKVIKAVTPTSVKGKVIAAVATPIAVGAIISEPKKVAETVVNAPIELGKFGSDVATFAADPSLESAKQIVKESPVISTAVGIATVGAVGATVGNAVSNYLTRQELQKQTAAFERQANAAEAALQAPVSAGSGMPTTTQPKTNEALVSDKAITPATQTITEAKPLGSTSKPRKSRSKARREAISQRVNVIVQQKNTGIRVSKKYLNYAYN